MKKFLSVLLSIIIALTSLSTGVIAFADVSDDFVTEPIPLEAQTELSAYIEKQTKGAGEYLVKNTYDISTLSAVDFLTLMNSGYDMSAYTEGFVSSLKANLEKNNGKLLVEGTQWYQDSETGEWKSYSYSYEDLGLYGAAITILEKLDYNPEDFEGYNIVSAFESIDLENDNSNPYYYRVAIEAAKGEFAKTLCDNLVNKYYVMGSGLNYWGFSCDNTAHFLASISKYKDNYKDYVEDAKKVIKTYTKKNGAFADNTYVTEVNPDSTALAMMAFASVGDVETAFTYYKNLVEGFEGKTGVFKYNNEDNLYATKDALLALEYFKTAVEAQGFEHPEEVLKTTVTKATTKKNGIITKTCVICEKSTKTTIYYPKTIKLSSTKYTYSGKTIKPRITVIGSNGKTISADNYTVKFSNNTKVGTAKATITFKGNYSGSVTKTFAINPKATSISKLSSPKAKQIKVNWKKQSTQTSGYQIQLATDKSFSKNKKLVTVSGSKATSKTVKSLKANKKYYVRVRTFKTVDGNKYYSGWSAAKTVKTKK